MTVTVSEGRRATLQPLETYAPPRSGVLTIATSGVALAAILVILAFTNAAWPIRSAAVVPYEQLVRNAHLFHERFPAFATVPPAPFALLAWSCVIGLWLVYLPLVWKMRAQPIDVRMVAVGAVALGLLAVLVPPLFSTDPFSYAMYGRFASVYHANPYLATANSVAPADPLTPYLYWRDIPSPYGPLWTLLSQALMLGKGATPLELILRFKVVAFALVMLDGWAIYRLVQRRWPEQAGWAYLAFAWNPLVLIEGIVIGHNDVLILAVMLGSACLLLRSRPILSIAGLTASALIKYSTLPVVGLGGLRLLLRAPMRGRPWLAVRIGATMLAVAACAFLPYWTGYSSIMSTVNEPGRGLNNFLLRGIGWALSVVTGGWVSARTPARAVALAAALFGIWQVTTIWRTHWRLEAWTIHDELAAWSESLTVFLLLWPRIHTWYFLVPLGLSLAAGNAARRISFWALTVFILLSYVSYFK